jgi:protein-L-isoaspartate(D-aspartate) O-methyltransferase
VLHVGSGLGYYTVVMGECVGPGGRVLALEVDESLAAPVVAVVAVYPRWASATPRWTSASARP